MSFKLIGGLFITAGFGILGLWLSRSEDSKVRDVKELYDFILFVYKRVSESMTPLCEICEEYGKARNYGFAKLLSENGTDFTAAIAEYFGGELDKESSFALEGFGKYSGTGFLSEERDRLAKLSELLKIRFELLSEKQRKNKALHRNLWLIAGLIIMIILI